MNATFPPFILLPLMSVMVAVSVMFSPMYPVCLVTVILLANFLTLTVYVLVVVLYWLFPLYVMVIVWFPPGRFGFWVIVQFQCACLSLHLLVV